MNHSDEACWPPTTRDDFCECLKIFYNEHKREAKIVTVPATLWRIWWRWIPSMVARELGYRRDKVPIGRTIFGLMVCKGTRFALA